MLTQLYNLFKDKPEVSLLDMGFAGSGYIENILEMGNIIYTGLDRDLARIKGNGLKMSERSSVTYSRRRWRKVLSAIKYIHADIITYSSSTLYDIVISISVIEHMVSMGYGGKFDVHSDLKAIRSMKKLVKPGGYLLLTFPCGVERIFSPDLKLKDRLEEPLKQRFRKGRQAILISDTDRISAYVGDWEIVEERYYVEIDEIFELCTREVALSVIHSSSTKTTPESLCGLLLRKY